MLLLPEITAEIPTGRLTTDSTSPVDQLVSVTVAPVMLVLSASEITRSMSAMAMAVDEGPLRTK